MGGGGGKKLCKNFGSIASFPNFFQIILAIKCVDNPRPRLSTWFMYAPLSYKKEGLCILGLCGPMFTRHIELVKELIFVFG